MPTRQPREVTFYCEWGYHTVTELRMPGPVPVYCREHRKEALALSNTARVRKHRAQQPAAKRGPGRPRKS